VEKPAKIATGIGIGLLLLCGCCVAGFGVSLSACTRARVVQPAADISTRSAAGPLTEATVEHVWWSSPHGMVHQTTSHDVDDSGRLELSLLRDTERIMPLCMHGVPEYHHQLCVDAEGYRPVGLVVRDDHLPVTGELELEPGEGSCHGQVGWGEPLQSSLTNADTFTILPPR